MAWLNLTMPNQTVKNGLKAKKIKLLEIIFFLKKQLIKFSCTYWPLSFCKIFKKFLEPVQIYEDVPFSDPKYPNLSQNNPNILVQIITVTFIYLLALLIGQNFKKILTADPELWKCTIFGPKMVHLPKIFFWKIINITLIYLLAPFIA